MSSPSFSPGGYQNHTTLPPTQHASPTIHQRNSSVSTQKTVTSSYSNSSSATTKQPQQTPSVHSPLEHGTYVHPNFESNQTIIPPADKESYFVDLGEGGQPLQYLTKSPGQPVGSPNTERNESENGYGNGLGKGRIKSIFSRKSFKNLRASSHSTAISLASPTYETPPPLPGSPSTVKEPAPENENDPKTEDEMASRINREPKISNLGIRDELDEVTYAYALKVAYINRLLQTTVTSPLPQSQLQLQLQPSINNGKSSPSSSRSFGSSHSSNPLHGSNSIFPTNCESMPSIETKSNNSHKFSFGKKRTQPVDSLSGAANAKFPKDFLPSFWEILGADGGDVVWRGTVNTFLSNLPNKKATKTASGLNLREIPTFLECFSGSIPDNITGLPSSSRAGRHYSQATTVHKHQHIGHLISLLQTALQSHFSPMNKKITEKDKDLYFLIRTELDSYSLSPDSESGKESSASSVGLGYGLGGAGEVVSSPMSQAPSLSGASAYSTDITVPSVDGKSSMTSPALYRSMTNASGMSTGAHSSQTKHSDQSIGSAMKTVDLVDVVKRVFGIDSLKLTRDLEAFKRAGLNERSYLSDIKQHLSDVNGDPNSKSSLFLSTRASSLQSELATLLQARPDLASSLPFNVRPIHSETRQELFFTPNNRKDAIYSRLIERTHLVLGSETPLSDSPFGERDLIELCAGVWGIQSKSAKELEVVVQIWENSVSEYKQMHAGRRGSSVELRYISEIEWAKRVKEAIFELEYDAAAGFDSFEKRAVVGPVWMLHDKLQKLVSDSLSTIYPTTVVPPSRPPASVISLLVALYDSSSVISLLPGTATVQSWNNIADELRAHAVGEYVQRNTEFQEHASCAEERSIEGSTASVHTIKDPTLEGFEKLADWIEAGIRRVSRVWPRGFIDGRLNPTGTILSKQLPLFLAELQILEEPQEGIQAETVFGVYERTARLLSLWEDFCPTVESHFDLDGFFEPYVREWLRNTEDVQTHEWVNRAVTMDSWVPEGNARHSQSVLDLFDCIRKAVSRLLTELPLGEYNRACYLIDFSRTASGAISQYATTVQALFAVEMNGQVTMTAKMDVPPAVTGKAGAWLAKSKQAVKSLERKKIEGFALPPTACVKLTDMIAAKACVEDLSFAMEADETARIVKDHKLMVGGYGNAQETTARYIFAITITRGENLLSRGLHKAADAFVTVLDTTANARVHKSKTMIGQLDPAWEESFDLGLSGPRSYELACYDRSLVGKHDLIGSVSFKIDPASYRDTPCRELVLPLNPRGSLSIRIEMEAGEKHDIHFHLGRAGRSLDRAGQEMTRTIIDKMSEFIRSQLSLVTIQNVLRPLSAKAKKGQAKATTLSEAEYELSLAPLFEYLDSTFSTFSCTLSDEVRLQTMTLIWKRVLDILISILIPPLSDKEATSEGLSGQEVNVVFQWLKLLKAFFNAAEEGQEYGVPLNVLQSGTFKDVMTIGQYLDLPTPVLKEKCNAATKGARRPSLGQGRNAMGRVEDGDIRLAEILLRILRMR